MYCSKTVCTFRRHYLRVISGRQKHSLNWVMSRVVKKMCTWLVWPLQIRLTYKNGNFSWLLLSCASILPLHVSFPCLTIHLSLSMSRLLLKSVCYQAARIKEPSIVHSPVHCDPGQTPSLIKAFDNYIFKMVKVNFWQEKNAHGWLWHASYHALLLATASFTLFSHFQPSRTKPKIKWKRCFPYTV